MQLNNNCIYQLPDGRELIARRVDESIYHLLDPKLGVAAAPLYFTNEHGKILFWGRATPWEITDLQDTGRKATGPLHSLQLI